MLQVLFEIRKARNRYYRCIEISNKPFYFGIKRMYIYYTKPVIMKKYFITITFIAGIIFLGNCNTAKKNAASAAPPPAEIPSVAKSTYTNTVSALITDKCSPCHIPARGGFKKAYDNYSNVKTDIDEMIRRIELNPTDKGFMPFKKTAKLSDSAIIVFKQWKTDGMLE
jgi:uncharacterized membrane protein